MRTTSPNAAACWGVPASAPGPAWATRSFSESGLRDENTIWWPALAHCEPDRPALTS